MDSENVSESSVSEASSLLPSTAVITMDSCDMDLNPSNGVKNGRTFDISQNVESGPNSNLTDEVVSPKNVTMILISLWTGSFLSAADSTIVSTTANTIASSMNDSENIAWIATSYLLTNSIFQPLMGKVSEIYGRKTALLFAQFWFGFGCLLCSMSKNVNQFAIARGLAGIGGGGISALSSIVVTDVIPLRMRGMYQGYANIFYGAGQFLGPIIGGFCIAVDPKNGWRWMFSAQVPFVCFAAILVIYNIHEYTYDVEERMKNRFKFTNLKKIDLLGSCVLSCVIISNLMLFGAKSSETAYFFLGTGILSACLFYYVEKYVAYEQIVPLFIFRGMLIITSFVSMFGTMTSYGTSFLLPLYLQIVHNFTSFQLGVFNSFAVFSVSFGSLFAGYLLRHDKPVSMELIMSNSIKVSIMGCTLMFWGTLVTLGLIHTIKPTLLDMEFSLLSMGILAFSFALNGFGYGVFLVSTLILIVAKVGPKHQAAVTGMNYLFRSIGSASGVGITLSIYQNRLYAELYHYFMKKKRPDGKEILDKLIENTFYIRQGLDPKYIHKVLNIYKDAISDSTIIVLIVATISLVFCITLQLYPLNARIDR